MIVFEKDGMLRAWAEKALKANFSDSAFLGVEKDGEIVAVIVYNNFRYPDIQMNIASSSPKWASRQTLKSIFLYPFAQLGCKRVTAITADTNQPVRAFLCRLGFKEEGHHPDLFAEGGAVSYGLLANDAKRWIEPEEYRIEQKFTVPASGPESNNGC